MPEKAKTPCADTTLLPSGSLFWDHGTLGPLLGEAQIGPLFWYFYFYEFESGLKLRFRIVNPADAGQFPENKSKMQISFNQGNKYDQSKNHKVLTKFHSKNHKLISNTK